MKFLNPHCPSCGSTAGIVMKGCTREDLITIWCASCRLDTIVRAPREECPPRRRRAFRG